MCRRCIDRIFVSPLSVFNDACACTSFGFLLVAVVTDHWLNTTERNVAADGGPPTTAKYHSGLWRKCNDTASLDNRTTQIDPPCAYIDYFSQVERDGLHSTDSILLSLRRAVVFPLISLVMLLVGFITCILSHVNTRSLRPRHQILILASGVIYISAGLVLLVGIIIYVGAVTEEAGSKKRGSSDDARFTYDYGASLELVLCSFVVSELTGTLSVHLYISKRRRACVTQLKRAAVIAAGVSLIGGDRSRGLTARSGSSPGRDDVINHGGSNTATIGLRWPQTSDLSSYTFLSSSCSRDMMADVQYTPVPLGDVTASVPDVEMASHCMQLDCGSASVGLKSNYSMSVSNLVNGGTFCAGGLHSALTFDELSARRITPV